MFDGQPIDFMFGSFEFDTQITRAENGDFIASAMGVSAQHADQSIALNDLNAKIDQGIQRGTITPQQG